MINADVTCTIKYFYGHFVFGLHNQFLRPSTYITMLRNPVERVISEYYFILREPQHAPYIASQIAANNMSLEDYVSSTDPAFLLRTNNMQTRFLSGTNIPQYEDYLIAKGNIQHNILIGITERFNESVFLFQKHLGWGPVTHFQSAFITDKRPTRSTISQEILEMIEQKNKLDILLYNDAKQIFQQQIDSLDSSSHKELRRFLKTINKPTP